MNQYMKKIIMLLLFLPLFAKSQNTFIAVIRNNDTKAPLPGVSVQIKSLKLSAKADDAGIIFLNNVPNGKQNIEFSHVGYKEIEKTVLS